MFDSGARLRRIQELLKSDDGDDKPDAILCIAGKLASSCKNVVKASSICVCVFGRYNDR